MREVLAFSDIPAPNPHLPFIDLDQAWKIAKIYLSGEYNNFLFFDLLNIRVLYYVA